MDLLFEGYKTIPAMSIAPGDILYCVNGEFTQRGRGASFRWAFPPIQYHLSTVVSIQKYEVEIVLLTQNPYGQCRYCVLSLGDIVNILVIS